MDMPVRMELLLPSLFILAGKYTAKTEDNHIICRDGSVKSGQYHPETESAR